MNTSESLYKELQYAYDFFNQRLFKNELPDCVITLQRKKRCYGYFYPSRFIHRDGDTKDEIAMNPSYFAVVPMQEIFQTLVHEMCHQYQEYFGEKGRRGYHNKEWGTIMESIGLMPSSTGKPGGAKTGEQMMDYIIEGGLFQICLNELLTDEFQISWADKHPPVEKIQQMINEQGAESLSDKLESWGVTITDSGEAIPIAFQSPKNTRIKFTCPGCNANAWGKASLNLVCGDCHVSFAEVKTDV